MNQHVVILDYSHVFHRCFSIALGAPKNYDLIESTVYHLQGTLKTLDRALQKLNITTYDLVFAEDRIPLRKLNLFSSYRNNRTVNHDSKKLQVKEKLKERGVPGYWVHSEGNEADDVIATLVTMIKSQGLFSIIITGDHDLWQLMDQNVIVFDPKKKRVVTLDDVLEQFSLPPSHIALHKTLWGDTSDCVPNACPRTQRYLLPILRRSDGSYKDFDRLVKSEWNNLPQKCQERLTIGSSQFETNWALVNLDCSCPLVWD